VDIVDSHAPFQNQWSKRKQFYKKQNYKIIQTSIDKYEPNVEKWKVVFEPGTSGSGKTCKLVAEDPLLQGKCLIKLPKKPTSS
jgi:hypothetical protein